MSQFFYRCRYRVIIVEIFKSKQWIRSVTSVITCSMKMNRSTSHVPFILKLCHKWWHCIFYKKLECNRTRRQKCKWISCQKFIFCICCLSAYNGRIRCTTYTLSVIHQSMDKRHIIFVCFKITQIFQIWKCFIDHNDHIRMFLGFIHCIRFIFWCNFFDFFKAVAFWLFQYRIMNASWKTCNTAICSIASHWVKQAQLQPMIIKIICKDKLFHTYYRYNGHYNDSAKSKFLFTENRFTFYNSAKHKEIKQEQQCNQMIPVKFYFVWRRNLCRCTYSCNIRGNDRSSSKLIYKIVCNIEHNTYKRANVSSQSYSVCKNNTYQF